MTDERTPPSDGGRGLSRGARPRPPRHGRGPAPGRGSGRAPRREPPSHGRRRRDGPAAAPAPTPRTVAEVLAEVPEDAVIVARRLTKQYGDFTAVDSLDLTIRAGEVFGLLGPNGAGKTTTVLMLLGLTEPTRGIVRVIGLDPTREPLAVKRKVGYLPDNVGFYGGLTGPREPALHRQAQRHPPLRSPRRGSTSCSTRCASRTPPTSKSETYSRGMRQRLGIADALVKEPTVLILDEPTIAIDPSGVEELLALLRRLVKERNLTVLLSSHILGQVQSLCDRVGFFAAGRLVAAGPLEELAARHGPADRARGRHRRRSRPRSTPSRAPSRACLASSPTRATSGCAS